VEKLSIKPIKPLDLNGNRKSQKVYQVFLGSGNTVKFKNKRAAADYSAMVSKNVNDFIRVSNILYADLFKIYRVQWPAMDPVTNNKLAGYVDNLNNLFAGVFNKTGSEIFNNCFAIYKALEAFINVLTSYLTAKKNYPALYEVNAAAGYLTNNSLAIQIIKSHIK
jgi:hypothetical protein